MSGRNVIKAILVVAVGILSYWFFHDPLAQPPWNEREFDRKLWVASSDNTFMNNPRGQMVFSLKKHLLSSRPSRKEVIDLLGNPDFEKGDRVVKYYLGGWSGYRIDVDSLDIHFDDKGKVKKIQLVQH